MIVAVLGYTFLFVAFRGFSLWLSPLVGIAAGEAISAGSNRKRATALQGAAAVAVIGGALLAEVVLVYLRFGRVTPFLAVQALVGGLPSLILIALLGTILAISRLR